MQISRVEDRAGHGSQVRTAHVSVSHLPETMLKAGSALEQEVALLAGSLQQWSSSYGGNYQYTDEPLPNHLAKSVSLNNKHIRNNKTKPEFFSNEGNSASDLSDYWRTHRGQKFYHCLIVKENCVRRCLVYSWF